MAKAKDGSIKLKLYLFVLHLFIYLFIYHYFIYSFITILFRPNGKSLIIPPHKVLINTQVGEVVSFSYESYLLHALPVHPKIYRVRHDISWEDVLNSFHADQKYLKGIFSLSFNFSLFYFI